MGFFGKDINAGFHGFDGHDRVQEMRQTEMYHINIFIQDLIKVRSPGTVKFLCKGTGKSRGPYRQHILILLRR